MPSEIRRLVFFHNELANALRTHGEEYGVDFPKGKVIKASLAHKTDHELHTQNLSRAPLLKEYNVKSLDNSVVVTFFDDDSFEHKYFNLTSDFISAALIQYCIENKIPLPKAGKKKLDLTEFNVCMDIILDTHETVQIELELER